MSDIGKQKRQMGSYYTKQKYAGCFGNTENVSLNPLCIK